MEKRLNLKEELEKFYNSREFKKVWREKVEKRIKSAIVDFVPVKKRGKYESLAKKLKEEIKQEFASDIVREGYRFYYQESSKPIYQYEKNKPRPLKKREAILDMMNIDEFIYVVDVLCESKFKRLEVFLESELYQK